jgi:hypothetical protein
MTPARITMGNSNSQKNFAMMKVIMVLSVV